MNDKEFPPYFDWIPKSLDADQARLAKRRWGRWMKGSRKGDACKRFYRYGVCAYCGDDANTLDHIVPRNQPGGEDRNDPQNFTPACGPCNHNKGDQHFLFFFMKMQGSMRA